MYGLLRVAAVVVVMVFVAAPVMAKLVAAPKPPLQRAASADLVIVGKVTAIEKETVEVTPFPGAPNKIAYKVAVVKVETPLIGADNLTHVKVGFVARAAANPQTPPVRPRPGLLPNLKEGDEFLFFLARHPDGGFHAMPAMSPPIKLEGEAGKKDLETMKKTSAALADPMKGLKAADAETRYFTAAVLVSRYRAYPEFAGGQVDQVPIPADESRLILKALLDRDWTKVEPSVPNPTQLFFSLQLTEKDGWTQPRPQPGMNFNAQLKEAFAKWLDGPGKDYQIKRVVAKKK